MGGRKGRSRHGQQRPSKTLTVVAGGNKDHHRTHSIHTQQTALSTPTVNAAFFDDNVAVVQPQSQTWKSQETEQREKWDRIRNLAQHAFPEHFNPNAYRANGPSEGPSYILPQTFPEYKLHLQEVAIKKTKQTITVLEAKKKMPKDLPPTMQAFNGKVFKSDRSAVLSQSTFWSETFQPTFEHPEVAWPSRQDFHEDGEKRENVNAPTRCGRHLPAPRYGDTEFFLWQYPLDQVGPLFPQGPSPEEYNFANAELDFDEEFEGRAMSLIGFDLLDELV